MIKEDLIKSDMVVFVTHIYYFDMSAQLKTIIDYLKWYDFGTSFAKGVTSREILLKTNYLDEARKLGENIR